VTPPRASIRLDKWLWYARFFKTRALAAKTAGAGHVRVNGSRVHKASAAIGAGDTLTFPQGRAIRVVEVLALGNRRGPAPEAQALYRDVHDPIPDAPAAPKYQGKGRPTKKDRRDTAEWIRSTLD